MDQAHTRKISFNFPEDMKYHLEEKNGGKKEVTWRNIPITRVDTNNTNKEVVDDSQNIKEYQPSVKKVTWNENLLEVRNISPRICKNRFRFPDPQRSGNHHQPWHTPSCRDKQPGRQIHTTHLRCSPQLQAVVEKARAIKQCPTKDEHNSYQWKPTEDFNYSVRETIV